MEPASTATAPAPPPAARRLDLDNLRNVAVLLLVVFHTARLFDGEAWHIKDAGRYWLADAVVRVLNLWQMPLLFFLAGMAARHALAGRGIAAFLRERMMRLFVPLLAGIFIAVYPQVYLERFAAGQPGRASPIDFTGGPLEFLPLFFSCCYPQANFSYHHLWFIAYLFAYSVLLAPVFALAGSALAGGAVRRAAAWFDSLPRLLLPGVAVLALELWLRPRFPSTHALVDDWANHAHFLFLLMAGWLLACDAQAMRLLAARWRPLFAAVLAAAALWLAAPAWAGAFGAWSRGAALTARVAGEWIWLLALCGMARSLLDRRIPLLTGFTRHAFPFYVVHQAFIVFFGWASLGWSDQPALKYLAVAGFAASASLVFCRLAELSAPTRFLLGMKPRSAIGP